MNVRIFLGGTVGGNSWRADFTRALVDLGYAPHTIFNPVVADWNADAQAREEHAKATAGFVLFYVADPMQAGNSLSAYSMVEATMALYDRSGSAVVVFDPSGMSGHALKAMRQAFAVLKSRFPAAALFADPTDALVWFAARV